MWEIRTTQDRRSVLYLFGGDMDVKEIKRCVAEKNMHRFYNSPAWKKLRKQVLDMDKRECQECKAKGRYTKANTVHHVNHLEQYPELGLTVWLEGKRNLISVCPACHENLHDNRLQKPKEYITTERW